MSSISAQGVVERASAELSKRINGLGLRGSKHHSAKGSVMERVTNVFCGGGGAAAVAAPEKPSRLLPGRGAPKPGTAPAAPRRHRPPAAYLAWEQLMADEKFLARFFLYFSPCERCVLAQVCTRWRDILYRSPRYWTGLVPVLQCREMRSSQGNERTRLYSSLLRRGFHNLCLMGASDEDALDLVNSFPLASKHIHTLSLRCSSITDRGLESLLDHLQVSTAMQM
jgi:F-box/leucine-rich repeat protein 16